MLLPFKKDLLSKEFELRIGYARFDLRLELAMHPMDGYDDGYGTQHSYPAAFRCILVDGNGRVVSSAGEAAPAVNPQRIVFRPTSRQQQEVVSPRTQVRS